MVSTSGSGENRGGGARPIQTSRLCVKNIPRHLTEKRLKEHFEAKGEVTDVKIIRTKDGKSRQFAFVGFRSEKEAKAARYYFNGTYIDTSRMTIDIAKPVGAADLPRPWSKYSTGSSSFSKKHPAENAKGKTPIKDGAAGASSSSTGVKTDLPDDDPLLAEFLSVMRPRSRMKIWANDDGLVPDGAEEQQNKGKKAKRKEQLVSAEDDDGTVKIKATTELVKSKKAGGENVVLQRSHLVFDDDDGTKGGDADDDDDALYEDVPVNEKASSASNANSDDKDGDDDQSEQREKPPAQSLLSDLEYLKTKVRRRLEDDGDDADDHAGDDDDNESGGDNNNQDGPQPLQRDDPSPDDDEGVDQGTKRADDDDAAENADEDAEKSQKKKKIRKKKKKKLQEESGGDASKTRKWEGVELADASETGRLFLRNLAFGATEEDLTKICSKFGPISDVHISLDNETKRPKGIAYVQFMFPEHAVRALAALDGLIFQGRLLHVLPAHPPPKPTTRPEDAARGPKLSAYKKEKESLLAANRENEQLLNSLYMRSDAVVGAVAKEYGMTKGEVLDRDADSLAVRVALAETHVIASSKDALEKEGINVEALTAGSGVRKERSKTVLLVKNLPSDTEEDELRRLFGKYGNLGRVILPPSKTLAVVEFIERGEAKRAFHALAYKSFKHVPMYLEWAPVKVFDSRAEQTPMSTSTRDNVLSADEDDEGDSEALTTVFVKNLNFDTIEDGLRKAFGKLGPLRSVTVARRKDTRKNAAPNATLSMGFGFVEYKDPAHAAEAIKKLQGVHVDGHALVLKLSKPKGGAGRPGRAAAAPPAEAKASGAGTGDAKSPKLIVRNLAFEATKKELRDLFRTFGELKSVRVPKKFDGTHRGFAFIEFVNKQEARKAMDALKNTHLYGRHLVLEYAQDDSSVEAARLRTIKHFQGESGAANKRKRVDLDEGGGGDEEEDFILL